MTSSPPRRTSTLILTSVAALAGLLWSACTESQRELTGPDVLPQDLKPAIAVQNRYTAQLMDNPGVVGVGLGLDADGRPEIRVFTTRAGVAGIPDALEGYRVRREVTGMFVARIDPTQRQPRPVPTGVSVGHPDITAGTIGTRVKNAAGDVFILSNNHVLAATNSAAIGDPAIQPGTFDGGQAPADQIGQLSDFEPLNFSCNDCNVMDAAIAQSSTDLLGAATPEDGYGLPSTVTAEPFVGQAVQKYGRTTRLTQGVVSEINVTVSVCYEVFIIWCVSEAGFHGQIRITPGDFSGGGDSGSLIVTQGDNRPVGLLFAGSSTSTIASPIGAILDRFNVSIDADAPPPPPTVNTDIAVSQVSAPASVIQGDMTNVQVTVENLGALDVTADIEVTLTDELDAGVIGVQTIAGGLASGATAVLDYPWNTSGEALGNHTLTASQAILDAGVVDENSANDASSTDVSVDPVPPPPGDMHVGDLDGSASQQGRRWWALVTIAVHDEFHAPVAAATVTGVWDFGAEGSSSCTTDASGTCTVQSIRFGRQDIGVFFDVTGVTHSSLTYVPSANHDPDGDSDGTEIIVWRPY